jgi:hypothetical protein
MYTERELTRPQGAFEALRGDDRSEWLDSCNTMTYVMFAVVAFHSLPLLYGSTGTV